MPRNEVEVKLPDPYTGFTFRLWVNPPSKLYQELFSDPPAKPDSEDEDILDAYEKDFDAHAKRTQELLSTVILEHNGWPDEYGFELPPEINEKFWDELSQEVANCIMPLASWEMQKLGKSIVTRGQPSRRGSRHRTRRA